jgi:hypothetical protein
MPLTYQSTTAVSLDFTSATEHHVGVVSGENIMMNSQECKFSAPFVPGQQKELPSGNVLTLGSHGGDVRILSGRVWLTSPHDLSDHVLDAGDSFSVAGSGPTLVETWDRAAPALIAWRPRTILERLRDGVSGTWGRCWELMNPGGRLGMGTAAAIASLVVAGLLFGPISAARVRTLAQAAASSALLHNAGGVAVSATEPRGHLTDGSDTRDRSRRAAQEAGRRTSAAA